MSCRVIITPHPLRPDRIEKEIPVKPIAEILADYRIDGIPAAAKVMVNDEIISADRWGEIPKDGDLVIIRMVPVGSGPAKDVFNGIAFVAAAIASAVYGWPLLVAGYFLFDGAGTIRNIVLWLQSYLEPEVPELRDTNQLPAIRGQRNQAKQWGKVPVILGKRYIAPCHGASPYTEIVGDDQYLRQLFVVGYAPLDITEMRIGETLLSEYSDVEYEILEDSSESTIYPGNVTQDDINIELTNATPIVRTTPLDAKEVQIDISLPSGLIAYDDEGNKSSRTVSVSVYTKASGAPDEDYALVETVEITAKTNKTIRRTITFRSESHPLDVKMVRDTADHTEAEIIDNTYILAMRTVEDGAPIAADVLPNITRIAVRIRASQQLNGIIDSLNVIAQVKVPNYAGTGSGPSAWTTVEATCNPAAMFLYMLQGNPNPRPAPDSMIDWESLESWWTWCDSNSFECNEVLNGGKPLATILNNIASTGRAAFTMKDGKYSIVHDIEKTVPVQLFTPRNSRNFSAVRNYPEQVHAVRIGFVNEDAGYQQDECIVYADGYDEATATVFSTVDLWGVTSYEQAWKAGRYQLALAYLRPETYNLDVDIEYLVCHVGDLVRVSHDSPLFGVSAGRITGLTVDGSGNVTHITGDELFDMETGSSYALRIRTVDGTQIERQLVTVDGEQTTVELSSVIPAVDAPSVGDLYAFGEYEAETVEMIVAAIEPDVDLGAKLTMIDAAPGVHLADTGTIPAFDSQVTLPADLPTVKPAAPTFSDVRSDGTVLIQNTDGSWTNQIVMTPTVPSGLRLFDHYEVRFKVDGSDEPYTILPDISVNAAQIIITGVEEGETYEIGARSVVTSLIASEWTTFTHTVAGKTAPPQSLDSVTATVREGGIGVAWTGAADKDLAGYEVRVGSDWETGTEVFAGLARSFLWNVQSAGAYHLMVKALDTSGNESTTEASVDVTISAPGAVQNLTAQVVGSSVIVGWTAPVIGSLAVKEYRIYKGSTFSGASLLAAVSATSYTITEATIAENTYWVKAVDIAGNEGTESSINGSVTTIPVSGSETTPTDVTLSAEGAYKAIILRMDSQPNLVDFSHFEVQISDAASGNPWYPLAFDGINWHSGSADEFTIWPGTFLVNPVPNAGTTESPVGRTLYYRARRVTKGAVTSDWTATISNTSAQSTVIESGDIAANSITTNKLVANFLTAALVQTGLLSASEAVVIGYYGTGTYDDPDEGDRRVFIDGDEIGFEEYTGWSWSTVNSIKLGGTDSNGNFRPFLSCRGVLNPTADEENTEYIPNSSYLFYDFENGIVDQNGDSPFTETYVARSTVWAKFGTYSLLGDIDQVGVIRVINTIDVAVPFGNAAWHKLTIDPDVSFTTDIGIYRCRYLVDVNNSLLLNVVYSTVNEQFELTLSVDVGGVEVDDVVVTYPMALATISDVELFIGSIVDPVSGYVHLIVNNSIQSEVITYSDIPGTVVDNYSDVFTWNHVASSIGTIITYCDDLMFISGEDTVDTDLFIQHYNHNQPWNPDATAKDFVIKAAPGGSLVTGRLNISDLPTSSTGLRVGAVWNDSGTLKIVG